MEGIAAASGRMTHVETSRGRFALDHIASVAGVDTPRVMAMMGRTLELVTKGDDRTIIRHLQNELAELDIPDLFSTVRLTAERELRSGMDDPAPHRLV